MNSSLPSKMTGSFNSICWDVDEISGALEYLEANQRKYLIYLTGLLNDFHDWDKTPEYYDLICGEWLMHFSHVVYAAFLEISRYGSCDDRIDAIPVLADHLDFQDRNVHSGAFNRQLRNQVAHALNTSNRKPIGFEQSNIYCGRVRPFQSRLKGKLKNQIAIVGRKQSADLVICQPYVKCSLYQWNKALRRWRRWARHEDYWHPVRVMAQINSGWRNQRHIEMTGGGFYDLLRSMIPLYIPTVFLEGFKAYRHSVMKMNLPRPSAIYTATALHGHTLFKVLAAEWRKEGTRILNHQHGGGYGLGLIEPNENFEIRVCDRFFTAGWHSESRKVKPLALAFPDRNGRRVDQNRILLNLLVMPKFVYRIGFQGMPGKIERMIADTAEFMKSAKGLKKIVVRPFPHDYGWQMMDTLQQANSEFSIDDTHQTGPKSYSRSAMVIHNYLGTSWLETLAMNIPTICFYDPMIYAFRKNAQPYIEDLERVGILYRSGRAAAKFVKSVSKDPVGWWEQAEVQDVRQAFVSQYADFTFDWERPWEQELRQWIE